MTGKNPNSRNGFKKRMIAWNKGTKGICKSNSGSFKKGNRVSPMTEIKKGQRLSPNTEFKKDMIPHNKGKKFPEFSGKNNPNFKSGEIEEKGYIYVLQPFHPRVIHNRYILRSHLVMEKIINRYLTKNEVVHHKGIKYTLGSIENKQDDRPENLMAFTSNSAHQRFHKNPNNVKSSEIIFDSHKFHYEVGDVSVL